MFKLAPLLTDFIKENPALAGMAGEVSAAYRLLETTLSGGGTLFTCGNGGSAADAEHIVGELLKSFAFHRPLPTADQSRLKHLFPDEAPEMIANLEAPLRAIPLTAAAAFQSAFANDISYEYASAQMLYGLGHPGDTLIAISTSGNSKNVAAACRVAKLKGINVIGLTGLKPSLLHQLSDVCLAAPSTRTHKIQEYHLPLYHFLCYALEARFFGQYGAKYDIANEDTTPYPQTRQPKDRPEAVATAPQQRIDTVVFDFDGVMTNNKVYVDQDGLELVACDRGDGLGIKQLKQAGYQLMILSTEQNPVVSARAKKLGIPCHQGCDNKQSFLQEYSKASGTPLDRICFVGNDTNDFEAMKLAGLALCPQDSHPSIKAIAHRVLLSAGGQQVVREVADLLIDTPTPTTTQAAGQTAKAPTPDNACRPTP